MMMLQRYIKLDPFWISTACMAVIMAVSVMTINRAFFIGAVSGIAFLLFSYKKVALNWKTFCLILFFVLSVACLLTVFIESDSSLGRMLIYKVSWQMLLDNPITGIGWGNFQRDYGLYQAAYFNAGQFSQKEFLLAGNTFYAFNDYWELIVETGTIGFVGLSIFVGVLIWLVRFRFANEPENHLLKILVAFGTTIAVAALFTHVFEHRPFKIIQAVVIAYVCVPAQAKFKYRSLRTIVVLLAVMSFPICEYYPEIKNWNCYSKWERAKTLTSIGYVLEAQKLYAALYPSLKNDIGFLKDYSDALTGSGKEAKKLYLLKRILSRYTDNLSYLKLADLYSELGMEKKAEEAYLISVHIVPNRFIPKEALFNFYLGQRQFEKSVYWRNIILQMPIKVPSERVNATIYEN